VGRDANAKDVVAEGGDLFAGVSDLDFDAVRKGRRAGGVIEDNILGAKREGEGENEHENGEKEISHSEGAEWWHGVSVLFIIKAIAATRREPSGVRFQGEWLAWFKARDVGMNSEGV
jgi:hypothetical protein